MDQLIETIRAATASGATDEARAAGASACRAALAALEAQAGQPLAIPPVPATLTPDITALVAGLKGIPVEQLLDLAIAKLRTMVPAGAPAPHVHKLAIPVVALPRKP